MVCVSNRILLVPLSKMIDLRCLRVEVVFPLTAILGDAIAHVLLVAPLERGAKVRLPAYSVRFRNRKGYRA